MDDDKFQIEARYEHGRWVADVPQIPGCRVQAATREEAVAKGKARALRAIADGVERGAAPDTADCMFADQAGEASAENAGGASAEDAGGVSEEEADVAPPRRMRA